MKGGEPIFTDSKYRAAPDFAITHKEDNDTPVQSQPCRGAGIRNEGGSERTSEELVTREADSKLPPDRFPDPGCRGQIEIETM